MTWVSYLSESYVIFNFLNILYFMCMNALLADMSVHHICAWFPRRSEEGVGSPGTGVTVVMGSVHVGIGN